MPKENKDMSTYNMILYAVDSEITDIHATIESINKLEVKPSLIVIGVHNLKIDLFDQLVEYMKNNCEASWKIEALIEPELFGNYMRRSLYHHELPMVVLARVGVIFENSMFQQNSTKVYEYDELWYVNVVNNEKPKEIYFMFKQEIFNQLLKPTQLEKTTS